MILLDLMKASDDSSSESSTFTASPSQIERYSYRKGWSQNTIKVLEQSEAIDFLMNKIPHDHGNEITQRVAYEEDLGKINGAVQPTQALPGQKSATFGINLYDLATTILQQFKPAVERDELLNESKTHQNTSKKAEQSSNESTYASPPPSTTSFSSGDIVEAVTYANPPPSTSSISSGDVGHDLPEAVTVSRNSLTKEQIMNLSSMRFPDPRDRERLIRVIRAQQRIWDELQETSKRQNRSSPVFEKGAGSYESHSLNTMPTAAGRKEDDEAMVGDLVDLMASLAEVYGRLQETEGKISSFQQDKMDTMSEGQSRSNRLLTTLSASRAFVRNLQEELSQLAVATSSNNKNRSILDGQADEVVVLPESENGVCQCCFDEIEAKGGKTAAVKCSTGQHPFCEACVKRYVETWVYGETYPLMTVNCQDGTSDSSWQALPCLSSSCSRGHFTHSVVRQVVKTDKVWEAYHERIRSVSSLDKGHRVVPSFLSPVSCCADDEAQGISPSDSSIASGPESESHRIAEALTEAKIRRCPYCRIPFVKEAGSCNKLKCPCCNKAVCFVCQQKVPQRGYKHFCVHSYDYCNRGCGKCPLWTTQDEQDPRENHSTRSHSKSRSELSFSSTGSSSGTDDEAVRPPIDEVLSEPIEKHTNSTRTATRQGLFYKSRDRKGRKPAVWNERKGKPDPNRSLGASRNLPLSRSEVLSTSPGATGSDDLTALPGMEEVLSEPFEKTGDVDIEEVLS